MNGRSKRNNSNRFESVRPLPDFLEEHRKNIKFPLTYSNWSGSFAEWHKEILKIWLEELPSLNGAAVANYYNQKTGKLSFNFPTNAIAEARFLLPKGDGPFPAIILLHEHGGDFKIGHGAFFDLDISHDTQNKYYEGVCPAQLFLDAGFAVLSVDAIGFGSRYFDGYEGQQALAASLMNLGYSLAGMVAYEDVLAARWLANHEMIDASRIGSFGFSYGGFRSWQLAALSQNISASSCVSWMACKQDLMAPEQPLLRGQSAFYMLHSRLAGLLDYSDMAGVGIEKPMLFRSGILDPHMPKDSTQKAWDKLNNLSKIEVGIKPNVDFFEGGHICPKSVLKEISSFFKVQLKK